ncbi:unnamed protein product [Oikopleura dioica]|uniref:Uncharacterized protein n=1 Tax=Oikopleura dioica TaxID=34765 RepID=E4X0C4_OIKDI|nr:unnamed protein product [Oikopleura dioica]
MKFFTLMVPFAFANSIYSLAQDNDDVPQEENLTDQFWRTIFADTFPQAEIKRAAMSPWERMLL